jgi:hypothetical protein
LEYKRTFAVQDAAEAVGFDVRGFLACAAPAAVRAALWRLMRSFFFAWPLRRFIFIERRRSLLPIAYAFSSGKTLGKTSANLPNVRASGKSSCFKTRRAAEFSFR